MIGWLKGLFGNSEKWSINCAYHSWTVHDLSLGEAQAILETLGNNEKASVLVWRTGWSGWRSLRDAHAGVLLQKRQFEKTAPELPDQGGFDPEITSVQLSKAPQQSPFLNRKYIRFEATYPVTILNSTQDFKTETLDLGEWGLRLKDPVPDWVAGYCTVLLNVEVGRTIEIMCSLAEDQAHEKTRLEMAPSERQSEYLKWFENHPKYRA